MKGLLYLFRLYKLPGVFVLFLLSSSHQLAAQSWQFVTGELRGTAAKGEGVFLSGGRVGMMMRISLNDSSIDLAESRTYEDLNDVAFFNSTIGVVVGGNGLVLRTQDAGSTWGKIALPTDTLLTDIALPTSSRGYITGGGLLFSTENAGAAWRQLSPLPTSAFSLYFIDEATGIYTDYEGGIWRTADSGQSWVLVRRDTAEQYSGIVFASDGRAGFICGPAGRLLQTVDSGRTWIEVERFDNGTEPYDMALTEKGVLVISGLSLDEKDAVIQRSDNYGEEWEVSEVDYPYSLFTLQSICVDESGNGIAVSNTGTILQTADAWKSYTVVTEPNGEWPAFGSSTFEYPAFASEQIGVVPNWLFPGGYIRTTDGGVTWKSHRYLGGRYSAPTFFSVTDGVMVRERPHFLFRTTDGGESWRATTGEADLLNGSIQDMQFAGERYGFQVGSIPEKNVLGGNQSGVFYRSDDSGGTWRGQVFDWPAYFTDLDFVSPRVGWIAGGSPALQTDSINQGYSYGRIYRTTDGGESWTTVYDRFGLRVYPTLLGFLNERQGFIRVGGDDWGYPDQSVVLETTDAGDSWRVLAVFDAEKNQFAPTDLAFLNDSVWYGVGSQGTIPFTTDAGETWQFDVIDPMPLNYRGLAPAFTRLVALPDNQTLLIFGQGIILRKVFPDRFSGIRERNEALASERVEVYPNPAHDRLHIILSGGTEMKRLDVFDLLGRKVLRDIPVNHSKVDLDVSGLSSGVYQVVGRTTDGKMVSSSVIVE